jgi:hypothetical protein
MQNLTLPSGATPSALPTTIRLAIASSSVRPPEGDDWLHEVKYEAIGLSQSSTVAAG